MQLRTVSRATRRRQGTSGGSNRAWTQRQCHKATQIYRSAFSNTNRATVSSTDSHLEVSVGLNVFAELSAQPACGSHAERLRPAHLRRDQRLGARWTRAQAKVDAADDELRDASDDLRDASHARSLARNEIFYATERDLREKNRHLRAENARLRALVERLGGGHLHASASESESES